MTQQRLFGLDFFDGTPEEAAQAALALPVGDGGAAIVTPNPEIVLAARKDRALQAALQSADLVLPDGIGLVYASRLMRRPLRGRVPGVDCASALMARLAESGERVFLLGAKPGVAEAAAKRLAALYPGLGIAGARHGYYPPEKERSLAAEIAGSGARLVLVCLGSPKQELWMQKYAPALPGCLLIGLGGALDVYAGRVPRAPEAWRAHGLEWLFRLLREPRRIVRAVRLPAILLAAYQERKKA